MSFCYYLCLSPSTSVPLRDCWGIRDRLTRREGRASKRLKMEPYVLNKARGGGSYSYQREVEKLINFTTKKLQEKEFESEHKPRGPSTSTCGASLTARRMTRFEPASKPRGSQGGCPVEPESRLLMGSCEITPETASEMLRTTNQLLQVVLQLLQQGPEV